MHSINALFMPLFAPHYKYNISLYLPPQERLLGITGFPPHAKANKAVIHYMLLTSIRIRKVSLFLIQ